MQVYSIRFFHYIAIDTIKWHVHSKHDDQDDNKMNSLQFLLVEIFLTLIRQNFPMSNFCTIQWLIDM